MNKLPLLLITLMSLTNSQVRADKVDDLIINSMKALHIPGVAVAVLQDGKAVKMKGYGLASIDYDVPVKASTPFLLASMTKSFTGTGIMMLVEEGKVKLNEPISTYLPDTPESWKGITVRQLLSHTAGLKDRFEENPFVPANWKLGYSEDTMYKAARETPVDFKPGERFQYSDQGFFLLGMIIEKVSGERYPAFLKKHIFEPLGMKSSATVNLSMIVKGMAMGYTQIGGVNFHNNRRTDYGMVSHFGMISSIEDLATWDAALYGEKLLKHSSIEEMWTPSRLGNGEPFYAASYGSYGLGWFTDEFNGHRSVGHGGSTGTAYLRFPEDKLTVIVLTNLEQIAGGDAPGLAKAISRMYLPALRWSSLKVNPDPMPELGKRLKEALSKVAAGDLDEKLFEPSFLAALKPVLAQQKAGLAQLGPIEQLDFLDAKAWGKGRLVHYRAKFKSVTLYATAMFDPQGRIEYMAFEAAED